MVLLMSVLQSFYSTSNILHGTFKIHVGGLEERQLNVLETVLLKRNVEHKLQFERDNYNSKYNVQFLSIIKRKVNSSQDFFKSI